MKKEAKNHARRQFLKNTTLAALSVGFIAKTSRTTAQTKLQSPDNCTATTEDYYGEGPFYTANPPSISNNQLAPVSEPGTKLIISGRVMNLDCSQIIPNTVIDIWHANDAGAYDNTGGYHLRGKTTSNAHGFYIFETIKPGRYLNGATYRPSHIHFKITPPSFPTLTTQLYFQGDPYIAGDAAASVTSGTFDATPRIINLTNNNGTLEGTWDIVVSGNGIPSSIHNIHLDKGMIYKVSPNPASNYVEINYGVFRPANISITVCDVLGKTVAELEKSHLEAEKYTAQWNPAADLPNGHYFVTLKVNDLQVHYSKIVLQR